MKRLLLIYMCLAMCNIMFAQTFEEINQRFESFSQQAQANFDAFKQQSEQEYESFRQQVNQQYAEFMRQAWERFNAVAPVTMPKEETVPPVVIKDEDKERPIKDNPIVIEELIDVPVPTPQPQPIEPIQPQPQPTPKFVFTLYGTQMQVSLADQHRFRIATLDEQNIAAVWERLMQADYDIIIHECLALRDTKDLCDWSYLRMLDEMSKAFFGMNTNEAELLKAYIYCQSGYQMRLAFVENRLIMLYGSQHQIFNKGYWEIDGRYFYCDYEGNPEQAMICNAEFPHEQALSLYVPQKQLFAHNTMPIRTLQSNDVDWLTATVSVEGNTISFCDTYPTSCINNNPLTRWAMYANMPLSQSVQDALYPTLRQYIANRSTAVAVDILCHWVQTAFVYEYDDKVWGGDRAFFAEETLYYPYADCEDRSILLTRVVRDLLGLDCALVYYPGHLATAIAVGDNIQGDYILIDGKRFLVCDPTYIGAPIGMTMPGMDNQTAKVIRL